MEKVKPKEGLQYNIIYVSLVPKKIVIKNGITMLIIRP